MEARREDAQEEEREKEGRGVKEMGKEWEERGKEDAEGEGREKGKEGRGLKEMGKEGEQRGRKGPRGGARGKEEGERIEHQGEMEAN